MLDAKKIESQHPLYKDICKDWRICRDVYAGERAVKERGEEYLPKPETMAWSGSTKRYDSFRKAAPFFNAFARTEQSLRGCVFSNPPEIVAPESLLEEISHEKLTVIAEQLLTDLLIVGRAIIEIATSEGYGPVVWRQREAEQLINWRMQADRAVFHLVTYRESDDGWGVDEVEIIRLIEMTESGITVKIFEKIKEKWMETSESFSPSYRGRKVMRFPVLVTGIERQDWIPDKPPMLDIANMVLSHYRAGALHTYGSSLTALPTPVIMSGQGLSGSMMRQGGKNLTSDTNEPIILTDSQDRRPGLVLGAGPIFLPKDADAKMLEVTGAGITEIRESMQNMEARMAALGARVLMSPQRAAETAEAVRLKSMGDISVLHAASNAIDNIMTDAMMLHSEIIGASGEVKFTTNKDFLDNVLSAQEVNALVKLFESGGITREILIRQLVAGQAIQPSAVSDYISSEEDKEEDEKM